ncbi:MAG: tetratricopeptide repeat protein [Chloracidobacterium sp.]|nr:tetratricopeptide repeat protein [Chloracidobacterium sp.]
MSFDKTKAMRNAERYVAQGKIRSAISEYRSVVDHDPRDIATLNMLGDLHAKSSDKREAVECYLQVAEHYNKQGFAQKAIAMYNKVSRIQPNSIEVLVKLAELHKGKGALSEAKEHYTALAEHYQKNGRRLEALAMWKQIALLDPNNTEVCMSLADSYVRENQKEDAVEAYAEAGARFSRQGKNEDAIRALMKGFDIKSTDLRILSGIVSAQTALGRAGKAASLLEEILENEPYNRDVLYLLIECCIDSQNAVAAEKAVVRLVEIEPANYPKFLDLIRIYLNVNDPESAARILTMSSEYLLAGGQSDECCKWINEILERDPAQLTGLRLLVRYNSWLNDENGFRLSLERLYTAAASQDAVEDERFALAQLVVILPHEIRFRDRLTEINEKYGFEDNPIDEELLKAQFAKEESGDAEIELNNGNKAKLNGHKPENSGDAELDSSDEIIDAEIIEDSSENKSGSKGGKRRAKDKNAKQPELSHADELKIQKEIESITFYIENDYDELAEKALAELVQEFGDREEFAALRNRMGAAAENEVSDETPADEVTAETESQEVVANTIGVDEIRSEFGIEGAEDANGADYETHYHTAVAYQGMGMIEDAIREFQDAINLTSLDDGTRRFYYCANLLGHCFMQNGMANHAVTWFNRALETTEISDEEQYGLWYELAAAYEANGEEEKAAMYFEMVYAENVDFRDVADRVKNLVAAH